MLFWGKQSSILNFVHARCRLQTLVKSGAFPFFKGVAHVIVSVLSLLVFYKLVKQVFT